MATSFSGLTALPFGPDHEIEILLGLIAGSIGYNYPEVMAAVGERFVWRRFADAGYRVELRNQPLSIELDRNISIILKT